MKKFFTGAVLAAAVLAVAGCAEKTEAQKLQDQMKKAGKEMNRDLEKAGKEINKELEGWSK